MSSSSPSPQRNNLGKTPTIGTAIMLVVLLLSGYILQECRVGNPKDQTPPSSSSEPQSNTIQIFFTTPSLIYPDKPAQRTPPPHEQAIIADIDAASKTIDLATFEYNLNSIADALVRAKKRGVTVRLALDKENLEKPEMSAWAGNVQKANIPIAWEETQAFLHSKFIVIDQAIVWMGSWNVTINDTYRNNNNLIRFTTPAIVQNYAAEFSQMSKGVFGSKKDSLAPHPKTTGDGFPIENYFSPQDGIEERIVKRLLDAKSSILFLAFSYTSDPVAKAMIERKNAGVSVKGVFESRNARGIGSEFAVLKKAGIDVLEDGNCYTMHHKVIIIDDKTVLTGSYNFTKRAEETNDENMVFIDDQTIARQYREEFDRVYQQAQQPTRCGQ